jgi:hypothetical protein
VIDELNNGFLQSAGFIKNNDCYRIGLSMDGGGIRGMLLAT